MIYLSEGLCINPSEYCALESVGATSRQIELVTKRDISISNNAVEICNLYLNGAINATKILNMTYQSGMIYNLNISCLNDVNITNDLTVRYRCKHIFYSELFKCSRSRTYFLLVQFFISYSLDLIEFRWQKFYLMI